MGVTKKGIGFYKKIHGQDHLSLETLSYCHIAIYLPAHELI